MLRIRPADLIFKEKNARNISQEACHGHFSRRLERVRKGNALQHARYLGKRAVPRGRVRSGGRRAAFVCRTPEKRRRGRTLLANWPRRVGRYQAATDGSGSAFGGRQEIKMIPTGRPRPRVPRLFQGYDHLVRANHVQALASHGLDCARVFAKALDLTTQGVVRAAYVFDLGVHALVPLLRAAHLRVRAHRHRHADGECGEHYHAEYDPGGEREVAPSDTRASAQSLDAGLDCGGGKRQGARRGALRGESCVVPERVCGHDF